MNMEQRENNKVNKDTKMLLDKIQQVKNDQEIEIVFRQYDFVTPLEI